jgi:thiol-disulfide isomerase/thioredoxin
MKDNLEPTIVSEMYNYEHFEADAIVGDVKQYHARAPQAGQSAPPFNLEDTDGNRWRLSEHLGRPVLLVTGSSSCPLTRGSAPALRQLYAEYGDRVHFVTLYVREAHPGEHLPAHQSMDQKRKQASFLKSEDSISWPVLVDTLDGSTHHNYGMMPNAAFLIGADGYISFRGMIAHGPTIRSAIDALIASGGAGVVQKGEDRSMHLLGATAFGWDAIERSGPTAVEDLQNSLPPVALHLRMGEKMAGILRPIAARSRRLPAAVRFGAAAAGVLLAIGLVRSLRSGSDSERDRSRASERKARREPETSRRGIAGIVVNTDRPTRRKGSEKIETVRSVPAEATLVETGRARILALVMKKNA